MKTRIKQVPKNKKLRAIIKLFLLFLITMSGFLFLIPNLQNTITVTSDTMFHYDNSNYMHIQYPITSSRQLNQYLEHYIQSTISNFHEIKQTSTTTSNQHIPPELNIDYDMTTISERFLSIRFDIYTYITSPITKTTYVNYDAKLQRFFQISDILKINTFTSYLQSIGIHDVKINKLTTKDFQLTNDGLILDQTTFAYDILQPHLLVNLTPKLNIDSDIKHFPNELSTPTKQVITDKPMIAITFDDGPSSKYTPLILEILHKHNSRATFFIIGKNIPKYTDLLVDMIHNGNEIGNHTFNHKRLTTLSNQEAMYQIQQTQDTAKEYLNYTIHFIRPPYGVFLPATSQLQVPQIKWTLDTRDWETRNTKSIIKNVMSSVKPNDIILFHDVYKTTALAIEELVPMLIEEGYQLVTVSELLAHTGSKL